MILIDEYDSAYLQVERTLQMLSQAASHGKAQQLEEFAFLERENAQLR